jgi:hypothetical protein
MIGAQENIHIVFDLPTPAWLAQSAHREQADVAFVVERETTRTTEYDELLRARPEMRIVVLEPGDAGVVFEMVPHHETITSVSGEELLALVRGASPRSILSRRRDEPPARKEAER